MEVDEEVVDGKVRRLRRRESEGAEKEKKKSVERWRRCGRRSDGRRQSEITEKVSERRALAVLNVLVVLSKRYGVRMGVLMCKIKRRTASISQKGISEQGSSPRRTFKRNRPGLIGESEDMYL